MRIPYPNSLTDTEWDYLQRLLPPRSAQSRLHRHSLRSVCDALFSLVRISCPWYYVPCDVLPWQTASRLTYWWHHRAMGMGNYLIEGISGTSKTSVCQELQRCGYHAIHGDRELAYLILDARKFLSSRIIPFLRHINQAKICILERSAHRIIYKYKVGDL